MNKSFKGKYIPFYIRLAKRLAPLVLLALLGYFQLNYGSSSRGEMAEYKTHWLIFFIVCFIIGVYYHVDRIRTVVNEIRFSDYHMQIFGHDFNAKFEDKLDLNKVMVEIQQEELGKQNVRYCLEIYFDDKYYYLNKFNDWDYSTLVQIVDEYKSRTGKTVPGNDYYNMVGGNK